MAMRGDKDSMLQIYSIENLEGQRISNYRSRITNGAMEMHKGSDSGERSTGGVCTTIRSRMFGHQ